MEVLENAVRAHSPQDGSQDGSPEGVGEIIA